MNLLTYVQTHGITIEKLLAEAEGRIADPNKTEGEEAEKTAARKLNIQRIRRILATYKPSAEATKAINAIKEPLTLLILTEDWCGDGAQAVPVAVNLIKGNQNIQYGLLPRDEHPEIMEQFLTNGTRSIPIIAGLDSNGNVLFRWGARPAEGQQVVSEAKAAGIPKEKWLEQLQLWYARNKGAAIELELLEVLQSVSVA